MLAAPIESPVRYADSPWYALYTRHQHEKTVTQILTNKGFETLLPLYQAARRWKDRTKLAFFAALPLLCLSQRRS